MFFFEYYKNISKHGFPRDVLVTASDGHALCHKNSEEVADIHAISDAFEDLRETWPHKREEASRTCAFRIRL